MISGFCIHFSFLKSTKFTWRRFFWQRFWRIYPAYFVALTLFACLTKTNFLTYVGIRQFGLHALLLHNISHESLIGINPSFWSLATEAQLYLLFPVLIILRQKWGIEGCLIISFAVGLAWRGFAIAKWGLPDSPNTVFSASPFMTWFDWTLGAFVAERVMQQRRAFSRHIIWILVLIPILVTSTLSRATMIFAFTLAAVVSAVVLDLMLNIKWRRSLFLDGAVFIGTISYSLYLWHQPLLWVKLHGRISDRLPSLHGYPKLIIDLAGIFVLSVLSWALIEKNGIRLGKAWFASREKSNAAPLPQKA